MIPDKITTHLPPRKKKPVYVPRKGLTPISNPAKVRIWTDDPPLEVTALLSDERPNVEAGYGGWTEVSRPRRRPVTTWAGVAGLRLTLPILFDGWAAGVVQEGSIARLEKMAWATAADGEPPLVRIYSPGSGVPHQDRVWVLDALTWGDALANAKGNRTRQQVTLGLLEYVADAYLVERSAAKRQRTAAASSKPKKPGAKPRRIVSKEAPGAGPGGPGSGHLPDPPDPQDRHRHFDGEDLLSVAARELGDADRWVEIAELNGMRDPRAVQAGQVLRLP